MAVQELLRQGAIRFRVTPLRVVFEDRLAVVRCLGQTHGARDHRLIQHAAGKVLLPDTSTSSAAASAEVMMTPSEGGQSSRM